MATRKTMTKRKTSKAKKSELNETPKAVKLIRYKARGKYRVVDGPSQTMIEPSSQEVRTED